ncbi:MAG TPA: spermidine/putrescine ABC transporter substrate-binding protein [Aggregatilineales bacterium]|nr:spermidine/putrescine ABC transporter substrate-binding protein [Chloroflexota bacterium]HOA23249.1 spermidine/putrescine ABC transporter substrate-binding protein [Aggregatilineales bacterium]HPV05497.1 spermidine/putrescine ABC transporter substrate-binding protein [Aggregatilineales bacterium]HQA68921.1 spermidine/putrescine ABC transporter substrate-binding protein [Aggregatilineales bacterium]HQE18028.1 spermidine/putrescine ABC transporter substrate-binding protein [Aggregatilineales b
MSRTRLSGVLLLVLGLLLLAACSSGGGAPASGDAEGAGEDVARELQLFIWSEYIDPEVYTLFEEETGIRVIESNFASNEEMLAKVQGGGSGYDVIIPSDYTVSIMIEEGLLSELDHNNIPNLGNLSEDMQNVPYDPGNVYCVPYQWGTTGLGYNAAQLEEPTSWAAIFEPDESAPQYGRVTMLDDPRESLAAALIYLGYDINTTDTAQLEAARDVLIAAKPGIMSYDSDQFDDLLAAGESLMAHGWNGDVLMAQDANEDIAYTIPQEGGVIWIDNMCILSDVTPERKRAAEMFIDFVLRPEIGAMISEFNFYASPNQAAEEHLDAEFLEDPAIYPPDEVREQLQYIRPIGEGESLFQRYWDEVKSAQ